MEWLNNSLDQKRKTKSFKHLETTHKLTNLFIHPFLYDTTKGLMTLAGKDILVVSSAFMQKLYPDNRVITPIKMLQSPVDDDKVLWLHFLSSNGQIFSGLFVKKTTPAA